MGALWGAEPGVDCARGDKWSGPCVWPSWRRPVAAGAISTSPLTRYNSYTCAVAEVHCASCALLRGHMLDAPLEHGASCVRRAVVHPPRHP